MGGASKLLMLLSSPSPVFYSRGPVALRLVLHSRVSLASRFSSYNHRTLPHLVVGFSSSSSSSSTSTSTSSSSSSSSSSTTSSSSVSVSHPWPEWLNLLDNLRAAGYFDRQLPDADDASLPLDFVGPASACLLFARERSHLLGSLSRKDIEIVVEKGSPFLFKTAMDSATTRMKSFLATHQTNDLASDMVDLMRFLLSYAYNPHRNNLSIESSVRNLLRELVTVQQRHLSSPLSQNIEMKRGDWICPKCTFMNFARNMKCLECDEARPKRQLTGGEWDCPKCDFFNYGKNIVCLRCDCKRPGEASGTAGPRFGVEYNNENRAGTANTSTAPLEQRLANAQYQGTLGNTRIPEGNNFQSVDGVGPCKTSGTSISQNLDRILGRTSTVSETDYSVSTAGENTGMGRSSFSSSASTQFRRSEGSKSEYTPFVPLPTDMFNKPQKSMMEEEQVMGNNSFGAAKANELMSSGKSGESLPLSKKPVNQTESKEDKEQAEKSERWFKKVAELHDVTDLASSISDEDFPEIMPMRKGENRFVISKKKDRSLTSPLYKRRMAMEQTNSTNFVPFVPFPPDYFAKKDKVPETESFMGKNESGTSAFATPEIQGVEEKPEERNARVPDSAAVRNFVQPSENQQMSKESWNTSFSGKKINEHKVDYAYKRHTENSTPAPDDLLTSRRESLSGGSWADNRSGAISPTRNSTQQFENALNAKESWKGGFSGKSLEGSLVKEPDPLDMSEEAKAERWFRRAAQIKDISELSQIPDEDFPQIMPMRKGVNRFVVSKRKTPLERRLTSPQYRRNLPIVSSEPVKKENTES